MYQHAAERKVKIFSSKKIGEAQGLEKIRRKFWNEKAEELCQDRALKKWKATAIHGVIDTTWMLKKIMVLVVKANTQHREAREEATEYSTMKKQRKETVNEKVQRTLCRHQELLRVNERLQRLNNNSNITSQKKEKNAKQEVAAENSTGRAKTCARVPKESSPKLAQESCRPSLVC